MPVIKSPTELGAAADRRGMIAFWGPAAHRCPRLLSVIVRPGLAPWTAMEIYGGDEEHDVRDQSRS
jgi:hypothetical protein